MYEKLDVNAEKMLVCLLEISALQNSFSIHMRQPYQRGFLGWMEFVQVLDRMFPEICRTCIDDINVLLLLSAYWEIERIT